MEKNWKEMPEGTWIWFGGLPVDITDETLSAYLRERGLEIGPERIGVRRFDQSTHTPTAGAMVSIPREEVLIMLDWVTNRAPIDGKVPRLEVARCGGKARLPERVK
jgi:hypothetical protein